MKWEATNQFDEIFQWNLVLKGEKSVEILLKFQLQMKRKMYDLYILVRFR